VKIQRTEISLNLTRNL